MSSSEATFAVKNLPLFAGMTREQLDDLAANASVRTYGKGQMVVRQDELVRGLSVLLSGRIKLFKLSPEGREQTIYHFGPGEPFCLMSMFEDHSMPANVAALEESRVLMVSGPGFERMVKGDPAVLFNILLVVSRRLKEAMSLIESLSLREIPGRVAAYLLHPPADGASSRIRLPVTHRELAKIVGATPEALSRALRKLADDGVLTVDGRDITVLDRPAMERLANGLD